MAGSEAGTATERIDVLLVDDDQQWATLTASDIEREAPHTDVTTVKNASDCVELLRQRPDIDCVVADYRMPGTDGVELLERARGVRSRLPYLLVTSQGSEDVAARAIDAGVTDYLVKSHSPDQAPRYVNKIQAAVDQHRLRRAIEESEARYRTLTEQSRDGIALIQDGRVQFCNQRLPDITGRDREQVRDGDLISLAVHPDDRDPVRSIVDGWGAGNEQPLLHGLRIVRSDGTIRHCECTGRRVDYEGGTATLVSIRDVTERKRQERALQRERELNRTIQQALVEAPTRERLEQAVVEQLQQHGYALAWVAEQTGGALLPRVVGGDRRYVDDIDRSVDSVGADDEPSVQAARTGQPQFVAPLPERSATGWRAVAAEYRYRGAAALPLVYNDVTYGLLAVYHDQPDHFDGSEQQLLGELADTVAFAVHSLETQRSLTADHTIEATLQIDDGYYLLDLARAGAFRDRDAVAVLGTVPLDGDDAIQYVEADDGSVAGVRDAIREHRAVRDVAILDTCDPSRLQVTVAGPLPELLLSAGNGRPRDESRRRPSQHRRGTAGPGRRPRGGRDARRRLRNRLRPRCRDTADGRNGASWHRHRGTHRQAAHGAASRLLRGLLRAPAAEFSHRRRRDTRGQPHHLSPEPRSSPADGVRRAVRVSRALGDIK